MTAPVVVDASVVVKWYVPEQNHERARALRDAYVEGAYDLHAPALLPFEVVNALRYGGGYDDPDRLREAAESLPGYGLELAGFGSIDGVATAATALDITVYDAAYVALAASLGTTLYTADRRLVDSTTGTEHDGTVVDIAGFER